MSAPRKLYGCPVEFSLDVIGGKWKAVILARLKQQPMRYGDLRRAIPTLSDKVLTQKLQSLCEVGLIETACDENGAKRYRITETGASLGPVLQALHDWGEARADHVGASIASS